MQKTKLKKLLSALVCTVLVAAIALFTFGCNDSTNQPETPATEATTTAEPTAIGTGATVFSFSVTDADGKTVDFTVSTDKTLVGEALQDVGLVSGDEGPYGLYVKTVNGKTLDYDKDGMYWAFYINGEMAPTGVDMTEIKSGDTYSFKAEK